VLDEVIAKDRCIEFFVTTHWLSPAMARQHCRFTLSGVTARVPRLEESGCAQTDRMGDDSGDKKCPPWTCRARFAGHFLVC
jgi:hypothetical protein